TKSGRGGPIPMSQPTIEEQIKDHFAFRLSTFAGDRSHYLLWCDAVVTVRSQQMRAINLSWALREQLAQGKNVGVIGGGAAGLTFAAAAAKIGGRVYLFESGQLMHLQLGSWHRPLHPEIYTWPEDTAYRAVARLPVLGWSSGSAHDVAREIVS